MLNTGTVERAPKAYGFGDGYVGMRVENFKEETYDTRKQLDVLNTCAQLCVREDESA